MIKSRRMQNIQKRSLDGPNVKMEGNFFGKLSLETCEKQRSLFNHNNDHRFFVLNFQEIYRCRRRWWISLTHLPVWKTKIEQKLRLSMIESYIPFYTVFFILKFTTYLPVISTSFVYFRPFHIKIPIKNEQV